MTRLSLPVDRLRSEYDVIVVGSGYGGSVAALRIAERTPKPGGRPPRVCLLERGPEVRPGDYPSGFIQGMRSLRINSRAGCFGSSRGMFDLHMSDDISVLVGSGLGGTSLINAGVMLRPHCKELMEKGWPAELFADTRLQSGYDAVHAMIRPNPYPDDWPLLNKREALRAVRDVACVPTVDDMKVDIAVSFRTETVGGVQLQACRLCGDCVTGCNHSAKKTLLMNYLPAAVAKGVEVFSEVPVRWIEPAGPDPSSDGWIVHAELSGRGWRTLRPRDGIEIHAKIVVLAAGTLGSTEILQRSERRSNGRLTFSRQLGEGFSGNGDVIAFGYNNDCVVNGFGTGARQLDEHAPVGPTITAVLDERRAVTGPRVVIEEGAIPAPVAVLVRLFAPLSARLSHFGGSTQNPPLRKQISAWWREMASLLHGIRSGALQNTQTYLVLGDDSAGGTDLGRIELRKDRPRIVWPGVGRRELFRQVNARLAKATRKIGGTHVANPFWSAVFGWDLVTVHPLGGCPMGTTVHDGVVNVDGQVFRGDRTGDGGANDVYRTLYVCDGSVIPTPIGVNPFWTIAAIAERTSRSLASLQGELLGDPPEAALAPRIPTSPASGGDGEKADGSSPAATSRRGAARAGLIFTERMRGSIGLVDEDGQAVGRPSSIEFVLRIETPDLDAMANDPNHRAGVTGVAHAPMISPHPIRVENGSFTLFKAHDRLVDARRMVYELTLVDGLGRTYALSGSKFIGGPGRWRLVWIRWQDLWRELTTLEFTVSVKNGVAAEDGGLLARGTVRAHWLDVIRATVTTQVTNARSLPDAIRQKFRFYGLYSRMLNRSLMSPLAPMDIPNPFLASPTERRMFDYLDGEGAAAGVRDESHTVLTEDRVEIHLRRFSRGDEARGEPVLLVPGFGSSTVCFTATSPNCGRNFTEFLVDEGYDVWLLDYRSSELSPGAASQFSLDELARYDYPAAVNFIRKHRGGFADRDDRVHIIGHCMGSTTLMMALLRGWLDETSVRTAVCSQVFLFPEGPWSNKLKVHLRLPDILLFLRFAPTVTSNIVGRGSLRARVLDQLLRFYPSHERCNSPVCRRILFLYGEVCRHDQIDPAIHAAIPDMFNHSNLSTLTHIGLILRKNRVVDRNGGDVYVLPENAARIRVPIKMVQGSRNGIFLRRGGLRCYHWLKAHEDPKHPVVEWHEFPGYGHLDTFIGRNSYKDGDGESGRGTTTFDRLASLLRP